MEVTDILLVADCGPMDISASSDSDDVDAFSKQTIDDVTDIDRDDHDNPQLMSEYVNEIHDYMRHLELIYPVHANHLDGREVTGRMRGILIDWLVQVHARFHLLQETLYMTVAIIDRYLEVGHSIKDRKKNLI